MKRKPAIPAPPRDLSADGRALWRTLIDEYTFADSDLTLLHQLCSAVDRVRACQRKIARDGLTVTGSTGQPRPHPLLSVEAEFRRQTLACVRALRLTTSPEL
jgi:P27 family predicted phage terminase small subunit